MRFATALGRMGDRDSSADGEGCGAGEGGRGGLGFVAEAVARLRDAHISEGEMWGTQVGGACQMWATRPCDRNSNTQEIFFY